MSNARGHFRGQMPDEEILSFARKHWVSLLPDIIPYALYISAIFVFLAIMSQFQLPSLGQSFFQLLVLLAFMITGFVTHRFFIHTINHFLTVMIVTNYRIVEINKTIILTDIKESIDMRKIQDIHYRQHGLFKNLLKFGELYIVMGNTENKIITQVPNPDFFFRLLNSIKAEYFFKGADVKFPQPQGQMVEKFQREHQDIGSVAASRAQVAANPAQVAGHPAQVAASLQEVEKHL